MDFLPTTRLPYLATGGFNLIKADNDLGPLLSLDFQQLRLRDAFERLATFRHAAVVETIPKEGRDYITRAHLIEAGAPPTLPWPPGFAPWGEDALLVVLYRDLAEKQAA